MSEQPQPQEEQEVDLGKLFTIVGDVINAIVKSIGKILGALGNALLLFAIFVKKQIVWLVLVAILGAVAGYLIDDRKETAYISKMVVEPNFNSVLQLYTNVDFYNSLVESKDSITLAAIMGITSSDAACLKSIEIGSNTDENQKLRLFDSFIRTLDTTTVKAIDYVDYLKNFNSMDARFHEIVVVATSDRVAKKMESAILANVNANDYFKLQKKVNDDNLAFQQEVYEKQLLELDSLQTLYKSVLLKEAEKEIGTNINLAEGSSLSNKELAILEERDKVKDLLVRLNIDRANTSAILNTISSFPKRGVKYEPFFEVYTLILPLVGIGFVLLIAGGSRLIKYLNKYEKEA